MATITIDGQQRPTADRLPEPFVGPSDKAAEYQLHPIPGQLPLFTRGLEATWAALAWLDCE